MNIYDALKLADLGFVLKNKNNDINYTIFFVHENDKDYYLRYSCCSVSNGTSISNRTRFTKNSMTVNNDYEFELMKCNFDVNNIKLYKIK